MEFLLAIFGINFAMQLTPSIFLFVLTGFFLDQKLSVKKNLIRLILLTLAASFISTIAALLSPEAQSGIRFSGFTNLSLTIMLTLMFYLFSKSVYKKATIINILFIYSIATSLEMIFLYPMIALNNSFEPWLMENLERPIFITLRLLISILIPNFSACLVWLLVASIRKTQLFLSVKSLFDFPKIMLVFSLAFYTVETIAYTFIFRDTKGLDASLFALSLTYFAVILILSLWTFSIDKNRQWEYSQSLLLQQQNYTKHLEELQTELRGVQHDYKNLLAGIYLHASEGNTEEIQAFLSNKLFRIDRQLENRIRQQTQLLQIEVIEIKSLLMTKLALTEQKGVTIQLEVPTPFTRMSMDISDFLRIFGIFLDNAIEAASTEELPCVNVLLIQESSQSIVFIKNPASQDIPMKKIALAQFSTKGAARGFGLTNVKKILAEYPNVLSETRHKNAEFTQILTIKN